MTAEELVTRLGTEGGTLHALDSYIINPKDIEDDQLRVAWTYLQEEYNRFEVHLRAFEAILNSKLANASLT